MDWAIFGISFYHLHVSIKITTLLNNRRYILYIYLLFIYLFIYLLIIYLLCIYLFIYLFI